MYLNSVFFWPSPPWVDIVYWTLRFEVMFYAIIFAILLFSALRYVTVICIVIGAWSAYSNFFPNSSLLLVLPSWLRQVTLSQYGCFFALGVLMYSASRKSLVSIASFWIALFFAAGIAAISRVSVQEGLGDGSAAIIWFSLLVLSMYASVIWNDRLNRLFGRFGPYFRVVGLMTYPLYLLHYSMLNLIYWSFPNVNSRLFDSAAVAFILLITLLITSFIEPPLRRHLKTAIERLLFLAKSSLATVGVK
jgi:peptidoglycan/LPS O-acetylase OafA/YrhL